MKCSYMNAIYECSTGLGLYATNKGIKGKGNPRMFFLMIFKKKF